MHSLIKNLRVARIIALFIVMLSWVSNSAFASEYRAFSLSEAKRLLQIGKGESPALRWLGGMTRPVAFVFDETTQDFILVGQVDPTYSPIQLDDLVVAIRAVVKHGKDPLVSIDLPPENDHPGEQIVRFEGKVENTQFGKDLLEADVVLKKLGLGKVSGTLWGVPSYLDLSHQEWQRTSKKADVQSRFWFLADRKASAVSSRKGVGLLKRLKVRVQTVVTAYPISGAHSNANVNEDPVGTTFAERLTANLDDLMMAMPELRRLDQLYRLVGVGALIQKNRDNIGHESKELEYWLSEFSVKPVKTRSTYPLLSSRIEAKMGKKGGSLTIEGGIELRALVADVKSGSLSALQNLVLKTRPLNGGLTWTVPLGDALEALTDIGYEIPFADAETTSGSGMNMRKIFSPLLSNTGPIPKVQWQPTSMPASPFPSTGGPAFPTIPNTPQWQSVGNVGGVLLKEAAQVMGNPSSTAFFSLLAPGDDSRVSREAYRRFVTALWSVYYSKEDPGISIDPIAWGVDKQLVRYIGRVVNTDLGRVMREADYQMKKWAVGTETPDIPGFRDVDAISKREGMTYADAFRRFWFVPEDLIFNVSENAVLFQGGRMRLRTEAMVNNKKTHIVPSDHDFADFFSRNYDKIAEKYPIYAELFEYAKLVSIAKYLKQQNVPLLWFLLAHLDDVITENSQGTVDTLSKGSNFIRDFRIEGGVEMGGQYVLDDTAAQAIQQALANIGQHRIPPQNTTGMTVLPTIPSPERSFEVNKQEFSIVPLHSNSSNTDIRGIRYHTDIAIKQENEPGLELVRYFTPSVNGVNFKGEFGQGWHLLRPYRVVPLGKPEVPFLNILVPAKVAIRNLVTGQDEILSFDNKTYALTGYRPANMDQSRLIGLFWTVSGGLRLVDKLGNEFWFNESFMLAEMHFSDEFGLRFEYDFEEAGVEAFDLPPYRLIPEGKEVAENMFFYDRKGGKKALPKFLRLIDSKSGTSKLFAFGQNDLGLLGYIYETPEPLDREFVALRQDGTHILIDVKGNEVWFNKHLHFLKVRPLLVKAVIQGAYKLDEEHGGNEFIAQHTARLSYEFQDDGFRVLTTQVFKKGLSTPIYSVGYRYSEGSMLANVVNLSEEFSGNNGIPETEKKVYAEVFLSP